MEWIFAMIKCKYFESKDITPWHGDVLDHPTYQLFCNLYNRETTRYTCSRCYSHTPCCKDMTDIEIDFELWCIDKELSTDDRANPKPSAYYERLLKEKKYLLEEVKSRLSAALTTLYTEADS